MNREEYLELLRDYVSQRFSLVETEDIIRDYEEFFAEGLASGKSESEVISGLGSPKTLVQQLVEELEPQGGQSKVDEFLQSGNRVIKKMQKSVTASLQAGSGTGVSLSTKLLRFMAQCIGFFVAIVAIALMCFIVANMLWTGIATIGGVVAGIYFLSANVGLGMIFISGASICLGFFLIGLVCIRVIGSYLLAYGKRLKTWWLYHVNPAPVVGGVDDEEKK